MIGHDRVVTANPRREGCQQARRTAHLVGVNDVGPVEGPGQRWYDRARRMTADPGERAQDSNPQPALSPSAGDVSEGDELAGDLIGQGAGELEGISLAAAE